MADTCESKHKFNCCSVGRSSGVCLDDLLPVASRFVSLASCLTTIDCAPFRLLLLNECESIKMSPVQLFCQMRTGEDGTRAVTPSHTWAMALLCRPLAEMHLAPRVGSPSHCPLPLAPTHTFFIVFTRDRHVASSLSTTPHFV